MARIDNLKNFCTDIANAIRNKTGETGQILASEFDIKIEEIEGGGNLGYNVVTWADGTDEEIAAMLEAHYNGDINIEDYWAVGDERIVHLNATSATTYASKSHAAQNMVMTIIGFDHDELSTKKGIRTNAAITVQCREVLGNSYSENEYYWGKSTKLQQTNNYASNPLRNYLNNTFIESMPITFQSMIKTVIKKSLSKYATAAGPVTSTDRAFLLSYPEIFGAESYMQYKGSSKYEETQYKYYEITSNRIKYYNDNGTQGTATGWWSRSPLTSYVEGTGYYHCYVPASGNVSGYYGNYTSGLAPAFAL